jgi:hypothetical protein
MVRAALVLLLPALLLIACEDLTRPKQPVWNKQPCDHCHMVLSDPRYAGQLSTKDGRRLYFDDIGCMATYLNGNSGVPLRVWVRVGGHWRDARSTRYARDAHTPMGFGYVPRASGELDLPAVMRSVAAERVQRAGP